METLATLLALCAGNSPVTNEFPSQRPETRSFDVFFDLRLNKRLNKRLRRRWFETPSHSLWSNRDIQLNSANNTPGKVSDFKILHRNCPTKIHIKQCAPGSNIDMFCSALFILQTLRRNPLLHASKYVITSTMAKVMFSSLSVARVCYLPNFHRNFCKYVRLTVCLSVRLSVCLARDTGRNFLTIVAKLGPHMKSCTSKNPIVFLGQRSNNWVTRSKSRSNFVIAITPSICFSENVDQKLKIRELLLDINIAYSIAGDSFVN